jgi:signal transduction histidine kinase
VAARVLEKAQLRSTCCARLAALPEDFPEGAGVLLLTEEALTGDAADPLARRLRAQPDWSRLPVVLLTGEGRRSRTARRLLHDACGRHAHVTTLERPLRASTLTAVVRTALQHRRRQYDVARLLNRLEEKGDVLEEKVAERTEALRERGAQVRALAEALTRAEQHERRRLSRRLHDHLQQLLYGMKVHAQRLRNEGPARQEREQAGILDELDAVADEAIELTRSLAIELDPPVLEDEGLLAALRWLSAQMQERHGLHVALDAASPLPAPSEEQRALLFRLVRELLFNVVKHAGTDRATVTLGSGPDGDRLRITVADEGCGFDPEPVRRRHARSSTDTPGDQPPSDESQAGENPHTGLGLFSVRERLVLFDGDMTLETAPDEGTRVTLTVPVR